MNIVHIYSDRSNFHKTVSVILQVAQETLSTLKKSGYVLDIFLLPQTKIQKINKQWRGKNTPTNVLSFAERDVLIKNFPSLWRRKKYLGEIYISPDFVHAHHQSIVHITVHGVLHVLGYDHIQESDAKKMERVEKRICARLKYMEQK